MIFFPKKPSGYFSKPWGKFRKAKKDKVLTFWFFPTFWFFLTGMIYIFFDMHVEKRFFFHLVQCFPIFHHSLFFGIIANKKCFHCGLPKWGMPENTTSKNSNPVLEKAPKEGGEIDLIWQNYRKQQKVAFLTVLFFPILWFLFTDGVNGYLEKSLNIHLGKVWFLYLIQVLPILFMIFFTQFRIWNWECPKCKKPFNHYFLGNPKKRENLREGEETCNKKFEKVLQRWMKKRKFSNLSIWPSSVLNGVLVGILIWFFLGFLVFLFEKIFP